MKSNLRSLFLGIIALLLSIGTTHAQANPAVNAINQLGIDILEKQIQETPHANIVLSPYSIQSSLAMAYIGADGSTRSEMQKALHYPENENELLDGFKKLMEEIPSIGKNFIFGLKMANALFAQENLSFRPDYLTDLNKNFQVSPLFTDFSDSRQAKEQIDGWILKHTNGKIDSFLSETDLKKNTCFILVNAIYFNMPWEEKFDRSKTKPKPFHLTASTTERVPTMELDKTIGYSQTEGFEIVTLPYASDFQCVILLPAEDTTDSVSLNRELLMSCRELTQKTILLYLPRFKAKSRSISLSSTLKGLGMTSAFSENADFHKMLEQKQNIYIQDTFYHSYIYINERGTEAGSAMGMHGGRLGFSSGQRTVEINRPFFFAIQHIKSGTCIFLGKIVNPMEGTIKSDTSDDQKNTYNDSILSSSSKADLVYIPKDLEDCFKQLDSILKESSKEKIKQWTEDEFKTKAHFRLELWIKSNWRLWEDSELVTYFKNIGISHPNDMSEIILTSYYRYLTGKEIELDEQIKYYQDYWKKFKEGKGIDRIPRQ